MTSTGDENCCGAGGKHVVPRNASNRGKYTPVSSFDTEDVNTGNIVSGSWRSENVPASGLAELNIQTFKTI
ncbi:hypothetical protein ILUMI_11586, partial [Ignelater luminosus]